jgi:hypothetical protein
MASPFAVQIRIADEVQANLNVAAWLRECLENSMQTSMGTRDKHGVDQKTVQSWRDVVKAMEALTACKIKLDKNAKQMAATMTPAEELEAVKAYIRSLDSTTRGQFIRNELRWHERREDGKPDE